MAEMTIKLEVDPITRKRTVTIGYKGDEDTLPIEHEEDHRKLVSNLLGKKLTSSDTVVIERDSCPIDITCSEEEACAEARSVEEVNQ